MLFLISRNEHNIHDIHLVYKAAKLVASLAFILRFKESTPMSTYVLNAQVRTAEQQGKGASRRLRREALVPAIVYGANQEPVAITIEYRELIKLLEDQNFFTSPVTIKLGDKEEVAVIQALQRHPATNSPVHADFLRSAN